jgi:hypothetical protein
MTGEIERPTVRRGTSREALARRLSAIAALHGPVQDRYLRGVVCSCEEWLES